MPSLKLLSDRDGRADQPEQITVQEPADDATPADFKPVSGDISIAELVLSDLYALAEQRALGSKTKPIKCNAPRRVHDRLDQLSKHLKLDRSVIQRISIEALAVLFLPKESK